MHKFVTLKIESFAGTNFRGYELSQTAKVEIVFCGDYSLVPNKRGGPNSRGVVGTLNIRYKIMLFMPIPKLIHSFFTPAH